MWYSGLQLKVISQGVIMNLICDMCLENTFKKWLPYLSGVNELKHVSHHDTNMMSLLALEVVIMTTNYAASGHHPKKKSSIRQLCHITSSSVSCHNDTLWCYQWRTTKLSIFFFFQWLWSHWVYSIRLWLIIPMWSFLINNQIRRHSIAHPRGWAMRCILWVQNVINVQTLLCIMLLPCCMQNHVISHHVLTGPDWK